MQVDPHPRTSQSSQPTCVSITTASYSPFAPTSLEEDQTGGASLESFRAAPLVLGVDPVAIVFLGFLDAVCPPHWSLASWAAGSSPACPLALLATVRGDSR